jgi:hypothetical protein
MSPSLQTFEISRVSKNLFMDKDESQANGSQNIFHNCIIASFKEQQEHCLKSCCIKLRENEEVGKVFFFLPLATIVVVQDFLDLSQSWLLNMGYEFSRKFVMGMSKINMMSINKNYSSSSSSYRGWILAYVIFSKLPDIANDHQDLSLSVELSIATIVAKDDKPSTLLNILNLFQWGLSLLLQLGKSPRNNSLKLHFYQTSVIIMQAKKQH